MAKPKVSVAMYSLWTVPVSLQNDMVKGMMFSCYRKEMRNWEQQLTTGKTIQKAKC